MAPNPEVIQAIESAVSAAPNNPALRLHLAELLFDAGRPDEALAHVEVVLFAHPYDVLALDLASRIGTMTGDPRATTWARLHDSLSGESLGVAASDASVADTVSVADASREEADPEPSAEHDWDGFLREILQGSGQPERMTLADVGGLTDVKQRLEQSFLMPLRNPQLRQTYGTHIRGGLLLWGPPGCGKTFLARAVAGELGARFVSVGLHQVLDMWFGNSEKLMHELFVLARRHTPCVLFFDELDAIGHSRMSLGRSAARNVVAQLLVELDGVDSSNEGIFVIGATNQPWDVDPAMRRPGRFDRTMLLLPPDAEARETILRYQLRGRPVAPLDFGELARATEGMSGADLGLLVENAAERTLAEAIRSSTVQPIGPKQLHDAIRTTRPSTAPWFESARNHVRYANGSGDYDELANYLRQRRSR
jgi:SpoVK/Ycf46/Vps4 family AAA+-type ATPase